MPEPPIFAEFLCCPRECTKIEDTASESDSRGTVASPEYEGAQGNSDRPNERVEEKHLLLVRAKVIGFGENDDIDDHVDHQNSERTGGKQALSKAEVVPIKIYASKPRCQSSSDGCRKRLPQGT